MTYLGPQRVIELPRSGLFVADSVLYRQTKDHQVIGRHALETIERAELISRWDLAGVILCIFFFVLAVVAKVTLPDGWDWGIALTLLATAGILGLGAESTRLKLHCRSGDVSYVLSEVKADCEGFVVSLNDILTQLRASGAAPPTAPPTAPA